MLYKKFSKEWENTKYSGSGKKKLKKPKVEKEASVLS